MLLALALLLASMPAYLLGFNVDTKHPILLEEPGAGGFGQSVELESSSGGSRVFVGAPLKEVEGERRGGLYSCTLLLTESRGGCSEVQVEGRVREKEVRDGQLLGLDLALLEGQGGGELHTCAPRRQHQFTKNWGSVTQEYMLMQGRCWNISLPSLSVGQPQNYLEGTPKLNYNGSPYGTAYSSLGLAMHAVEGELVLGGPGTRDWRGALLSRTNSKSVLGEEWNGAALSTYSYMGYSLSSGKFKPDSEEVQVVVGSPRGGREREGEVHIVERLPQDGEAGTARRKMVLYKQIRPRMGQLGEYFGASLAAADLNGDGLDDLLVGSPLSTLQQARGKRESGRVSKVGVH